MKNRVFKITIITTVIIVLFGLFCVITELYFPSFYPFKDKALWHKADIQGLTLKSQPLVSSQIIKTELPFSDGSKRKVLIYLPKGYDQAQKEIKYPTYYLLHGSPGDETSWIISGHVQEKFDSYIDKKIIPPLIVVMPDGNDGILNDSEFIDSTDGKKLTETFIYKNLVDYMDSQLNTKNESKWRVVGGLSTGGFGAINIGLKHQDKFGYIQSFSGYSTIDITSGSKKLIQHSKGTVWANSPRRYLDKLSDKKVKFFLADGKADVYYKDNVSFNKLLNDNGFQSTLFIDEGSHGWDSWNKYLLKGLENLGENWQKFN